MIGLQMSRHGDGMEAEPRYTNHTRAVVTNWNGRSDWLCRLLSTFGTPSKGPAIVLRREPSSLICQSVNQ